MYRFQQALALVCVSLITSALFAQNAPLEGVVSDATGARIAAATLTLKCPTQVDRQIHSDSQGHFVLPHTENDCTVEITAIGFSSVTRPVASLQSGQVVLSVRQVSNTVTVNADSGYVAVASSTATKTDTPISEVPQEISVVTRDQIDIQAAQSVPEALRYSVGMLPEVRGLSTDAYEVLNSRGFQMEEYLDGMRLPNAGAGFLVPSFDPFDLQSIEILHGPASVLFGQAYPAGLVNMVSKQPRSRTFGQIDFTPGSYDRLQGDWDFGGPIDQREHLLYRVVGLARHTDQQVDFAQQERFMLSPSLSWRPDEKTSLTGLLNWQYDPQVGFYNLLPASGTVTSNPYGIIPTSFDPGEPGFDKHSRRQYAGGYLFSRELGKGWNIQQNFRFFHIDDNFQNVYTEDLEADNRTIDRYSFVNNEHISAYTLDTHAAKTLNRAGVQQTILMGVDYQSLPYDEGYGFNFSIPTLDVFAPKYGAAISVPTYAGDDVVKYHQTGIYGQDQVRWKRLALTLGGREDWTRTSGVDAVSGESEGDQANHAFTGRAGLVFLAGHGLSPYYSYSTSYQPEIGTDQQGHTFQPTTGEQHEVGIKYQPGHFNGFFTLSAYDLNEHNVLTTDPNNVNFSVQTGAVRSRGLDLDAHANLTEGLSFVAGYGLLQNEVTDATNTTGSVYSVTQGKAIYGTPRNQLSFWTDYAPHTHTFNGLDIGGGVRFIGRTFGDDTNDFTVPSSTLVDAVARYTLRGLNTDRYHWQLSVNATNLTDKRYVTACIDAAAGCFYGQRRNILGNVGLKW